MVSEQNQKSTSEWNAVKKLKREVKRLKDQLDIKQSEVEALTQRNNELIQTREDLEEIVERLLDMVYAGKVKVNFDELKLCVADKCVVFSDYNELVVALKIVNLFQ